MIRKAAPFLILIFVIVLSLQFQGPLVPTTANTIDLGKPNFVSFQGESQFNALGNSLDGVGDVNGDGYNDFILAAEGNDVPSSSNGRVYLFFGSPNFGWSADFDVSNCNASFYGETFSDYAGSNVAGIGDFNNDTYDDFVIAADGNSEHGFSSGQVYLILGKPTANWNLDVSLSTANASWYGENDDNIGSLSDAGDVNGDGYDDFLIGTSENDQVDSNQGKSYLFFGGISDWQMDTSVTKANASFLGETFNDYAGTHLAGLGDVNNDGFDDFAIGAPNYNYNFNFDMGLTYLFFGRSNGWSNNVSVSMANASFLGEAGSNYASRVSGLGDVNLDGYDDFVISGSYNDEATTNAGQSYLIFGNAVNNWGSHYSLSLANASFWGIESNDNSGVGNGGGGDINGDGYNDILIGSNDVDRGIESRSSDYGEVHVILGGPNGLWSNDISLSNSYIKFVGENSGDKVGLVIEIIDDVNDDGYDDILIGASWNQENGDNSGQVYLIFGGAALLETYTQTIDTTQTITETNTESVTQTTTITNTQDVTVTGTDTVTSTTNLTHTDTEFVTETQFTNITGETTIRETETVTETATEPSWITTTVDHTFISNVTTSVGNSQSSYTIFPVFLSIFILMMVKKLWTRQNRLFNN